MINTVYNWLNERLDLEGIDKALLTRPVPEGVSWGYTLGSATLFAFIIQAVTGIFLAVYYAPTVSQAYISIEYIDKEVLFGSFVRGLHHYGASAMVILVVLHMIQVFWIGAYKYPRELTWMIGVGLLGLTLGFGFTGYLLPWDQKAYWATEVGVKIAGSVPVIGEYIKEALAGGPLLGNLTLTRFYAIHMLILPALIMGLIGAHLYLVVRLGVTPPPGKLVMRSQEDK